MDQINHGSDQSWIRSISDLVFADRQWTIHVFRATECYYDEMVDRINLTGRRENRRPFCGHVLTSDPSEYFGDANCPSCGQPLFFVRVGRDVVFYGGPTVDRLRERLISVIAQQLGVDKRKVTAQTSLIDDLGADSLDLVELVIEINDDNHAT